jgi:hypothetical protein
MKDALVSITTTSHPWEPIMHQGDRRPSVNSKSDI